MENTKIIATTKRLTLRSFKETDLEDLYEYLSNPKVIEFEPYQAMTMEDVKMVLNERIVKKEFIAIELNESQKVVGNIYLGSRDFNSLEIGFVLNDRYWHQGFAKESCEKLIDECFRNGTHRIFAQCDPNNYSSWKLLESLGFKREGRLHSNVYFKLDENNAPIWKDTYIYARLNNHN